VTALGAIPSSEDLAAQLPVGLVMPYAGASAPSGWLLCDGAAVTRSAPNVALFAAIGTIYGSGNGSTTFNVPDLVGRVPVGISPTGAVAVNSLGKNDGQTAPSRSVWHAHRHITGVARAWLTTNIHFIDPQNFGGAWDGVDSSWFFSGDRPVWTGGDYGPALVDCVPVKAQSSSAGPAFQVVNYVIKQ
jgi:microcystin-dependent protein